MKRKNQPIRVQWRRKRALERWHRWLDLWLQRLAHLNENPPSKKGTDLKEVFDKYKQDKQEAEQTIGYAKDQINILVNKINKGI